MDWKVPFCDLRRRVVALEPELRDNLAEVFAGGRFILGDAVAAFEERFARYCGTTHGVGVGSGTDALWLALEALGIGAGDEVITAANTCAPTISAILEAGATPVLVDVDSETMTLDPDLVARSVSAATRCIMPVHLYGQCAAVGALQEICDRHGLILIEDCAQAHGAEQAGRRAGSMGTMGCFSFYPTKNLGALGDGGLITTSDAELAGKLRLLRQYGYDEPNRSVLRGFNSRLDEVQAAVLLAGLEHLDEWNARRRAIARKYDEHFTGTDVRPPFASPNNHHVYHLYVVRTARRNELQERLAAAGIATLVHYPIPIHRQPGLEAHCKVGAGGLSRTEQLAAEILTLPLYPELRDDEVEQVIASVLA